MKTEGVPYLDKLRERARLKRLAVAKEASAAAEKLEAIRQAEEPKQLSGAAKKRAALLEVQLKQNPKWNAQGPRKRKGKQEQIAEEWDELAKEERLYKKLKKGKILVKQYEAELKPGAAGGGPSKRGGGESDSGDSDGGGVESDGGAGSIDSDVE